MLQVTAGLKPKPHPIPRGHAGRQLLTTLSCWMSLAKYLHNDVMPEESLTSAELSIQRNFALML